MKRGLVISLVVFLSLSLGACGIGSLDKDTTEDTISALSSDESEEDSLKLSDVLNKITNNNEENEMVREDTVSNEKNTVNSDDKVEVKKTEESLTDKANIQKAKKEILKYATYIKEGIVYNDFITIDDHISGEDEKMNKLLGVKMYHFQQDREYSPDELFYNPNTGEVFMARQIYFFKLSNGYEHINPKQCRGEVSIYDVVLDLNGCLEEITNKEENKDIKIDDIYTHDENIAVARSAILNHATHLQEDVSFIDIKTIDGFIYKDEEASELLGVKMYHFEQNTEYSPDEFYYNASTGDVFIARQGILFRLNDYKHMNPSGFGVSYDIHDVIIGIK